MIPNGFFWLIIRIKHKIYKFYDRWASTFETLLVYSYISSVLDISWIVLCSKVWWNGCSYYKFKHFCKHSTWLTFQQWRCQHHRFPQRPLCSRGSSHSFARCPYAAMPSNDCMGSSPQPKNIRDWTKRFLYTLTKQRRDRSTTK